VATVLTGPALFDEFIIYAHADTSTQTKLTPNYYLDVEMSKDQLRYVFLNF
jgi:hypothetical protein